MRDILKRKNRLILWMNREYDAEEPPRLIEIEPGGGRTILFHRSPDRGDTRAAPLSQPQLFQQLPDTAITCWYGWQRRRAIQMLDFNARYRPRIADDLHPVGVEIDLDRLLNAFIRTVIDGIHQSFAQSQRWVADPMARLGSPRQLLDHVDRQPIQIGTALPKLLLHRPISEHLFFQHVATGISRKLYDLYPRAGKPLFRVLAEKQ